MITGTLVQEEDKVRELIVQYRKTHNTGVKNSIVKLHLSLVQKIAKSYTKKHKEQYDDLVQVGCIGLINAIDKFDLNHRVSFKTYSSYLISGEMKHYLRDYAYIVKQPRELQELLPKINRLRQELHFQKNQEPSDEEIAIILQAPVEKIKQAVEMEHSSQTLSLDQQLNTSDSAENSASILNQLEDKKYRSFQLAQEDKIILNEAIGLIKEQSKQVIEYTFYQDLTQTEIAKKLGISQMQVSRRLKSAMSELWEILNTRVTPW